MSRPWKFELAAALSAVAICMMSSAHASTVISWNGSDSFNGTTVGSGDRITFAGFTANQLTLITGNGTYEASTHNGNGVTTTFNLFLDLNGTWTSVDTWTTSDAHEQLLSGLSMPVNFASSTVTGIALTASPAGSDDDPSFDSFKNWGDDDEGGNNPEKFTFNSITATPLPATLPLFAGGLGFVGYLTRRRKKAVAAA